MSARLLDRRVMVWSLFFCVLDSVANSGGVHGAGAETQQQSRLIAPVEEKVLLNGYRRYQGTCGHCHGPDGVGGSFAPSLIQTPLPYDSFKTVVEQGSETGTSVMRGFDGDPNVMDHIEDIYAYLSARAMGKIGRGRPTF